MKYVILLIACVFIYAIIKILVWIKSNREIGKVWKVIDVTCERMEIKDKLKSDDMDSE